MKNISLLLSSLILVLLVTYTSEAQEAVKPRPSPTAIVTLKYEDTYVKVTYCQPHKRGREIFGKLVPYGKVWRTGANEATEITTTKNIIFGGKQLPSGTYSLFTIPGEQQWTIIVSKDLGQWGAYNYHEGSDVLRVEVPSGAVPKVTYEPFTINFEQKNKSANMVLMWDKTQVSIPIKFID